jgi:hypothetical protein
MGRKEGKTPSQSKSMLIGIILYILVANTNSIWKAGSYQINNDPI